MSVGLFLSSWAWIDIPVLIGIFLLCIVFNKQLAQIISQSQKDLWGIDYDLKYYRRPIYIIGAILIIVIFLRLSILN